MKKCFFILLIASFVLEGNVARVIQATLRIDPRINSGKTGEQPQFDPVLNRTNLIAIQKFILKQGQTETYCNMYNCNPSYSIDNYFFYLNPDTGQFNINCEPEKSGFHTLVIRNMDWGRDQYRDIEFKDEHIINITASWPNDDLDIARIREKTEEALKIIMNDMKRMELANNAYLDELKELYQFNNWAGSTRTNYLHLIKDWEINFESCGVTNLLTEPLISSEQNMRESIYFFQPTNMVNEIDLRVLETPSVLDAHETMMEFFENCSAWQPFQTGESIGISLGDRCYAGYPIGLTNSVFFVRNNIFVTITSGTSVYEIAKKIDQQFLTISLKLE
jgi:hypothetical protein